MAAHGYEIFEKGGGVERGDWFSTAIAPILVLTPNFKIKHFKKAFSSVPSLNHQSPAAKAGYASCCHALVADGGADTELKDVERKTALFVR